MFQYDGWRFVEAKVQRNKGVFGLGVTSMHSLTYNNKVLVGMQKKLIFVYIK